MKYLVKVVLIIIFFAITVSCVSPKSSWIAAPQIQNSRNSHFETQLEPLNRDDDTDFFVSFRLSITSKTDKNLEIDWNKTKYLLNGKPHEGFVFVGITPENIRDGNIPFDVIAPNERLTKVIFPYRLVARAPVGSGAYNAGKIQPGLIPEGLNGIYLVVRVNGKEIKEKIQVSITKGS